MGNQWRGSQLMTGIMCSLLGGNGQRSFSGSVTVTVGYYNLFLPPSVDVDYWGYTIGQAGSVSPDDWAGSGIPFTTIRHINDNSGTTILAFSLAGYVPNAGWTSMVIGSSTYTRSSASYTYDADSNVTAWFWSPNPTNDFGTTVGATRVVTWA